MQTDLDNTHLELFKDTMIDWQIRSKKDGCKYKKYNEYFLSSIIDEILYLRAENERLRDGKEKCF